MPYTATVEWHCACVCVYFPHNDQLGRTDFPRNVSFVRIGVCVCVCVRKLYVHGNTANETESWFSCLHAAFSVSLHFQHTVDW